jgi:hypothetical protein
MVVGAGSIKVPDNRSFKRLRTNKGKRNELVDCCVLEFAYIA